jgi:mono/diheme cytochrome c family protein
VIRAHLAALVAAGLLTIGIATAAPHRSYTAQQAEAGRLDYIESCAECHGGELEGNFAPALAGENSRIQWESPQYVYGYFSVAMPHGHPGQLSREQYVDIMAFILQRHNIVAGSQPLTAAAIETDTAAIGN